MAIVINIDVMPAKRKMSVTELAGKVGITMATFHTKKRKSQSHSLINFGCHLQSFRLSAWRHSGI